MAIPFNIEQEAMLIPLKNARSSGGSIYADCPFCGSKGALHISASRNVWNCMACQMKGSNNSGGGRTELYGKFYNVTNGEAYRDICDQLGLQNLQNSSGSCYHEEKEESVKRTPRELDYVYRAFLSLLSLSDKDNKDLKKRGLSENAIQQYLYKSVPVNGHSGLLQTLLSYRMTLEGIPGFYMNGQEWRINLSKWHSGLFCPVIDREGYIVGLQIRLHRPINDRKYIWFTSAEKEHGSSPGSPVHYVGDPMAKTVFITEGSLKANVAHELSKHLFEVPVSFIAVPGATQFKAIRQALLNVKDYGCQYVYDAFDMDKFKNPYVYRAMSKTFDIANEVGVKMTPYRWNTIEVYGDFTPNTPYRILMDDTEYSFYSYIDLDGKTYFCHDYYTDIEGKLIIPEPVINGEHPHEDVHCKLINCETGDYIEFKMFVDKSFSQYNGYTFINRKGIDDYFLSLVNKLMNQRNVQ